MYITSLIKTESKRCLLYYGIAML